MRASRRIVFVGPLILAGLALSPLVQNIGADGSYSFFTLAGVVYDSGVGSTDGTGSAARFNGPHAVTPDGAGNLYVADHTNATIRKITPAGVVTTLAGSPGQVGITDGTGSAARFRAPTGLAVDASGTLYVADSSTIRVVTPGGVVSTFAGSGTESAHVDGPIAVARFGSIQSLAFDTSGNLYLTDNPSSCNCGYVVRKVTPEGSVSTLAGMPGVPGYVDGVGGAARFRLLAGIAVDSGGNLYVADRCEGFRPFTCTNAIRRIAPDGSVTTFAGFPAGSGGIIPPPVDGVGSDARFQSLAGVSIDASGNLYVSDYAMIRRVTPDRVVSTLAGSPYIWAGTGYQGTGFVDGTGGAARFGSLGDIAVDAAGVVFIADFGNNAIRRMTPDTVVSTVAGTGATGGQGATDGARTVAQFNYPQGIARDGAGNLYVADSINCTIRKIAPDGMVTTIAGSPGASGSTDGTGAAARFDLPQGVASDAAGNLYVASNNSVIRKITPAGVVTTVAGVAGEFGSADGTGSAARFSRPSGMAVDLAGNIYVTELNDRTVRKITPGGVVTTLAGTPGAFGTADGTGSAAQFMSPRTIAVDPSGTVFVEDSNLIRRITPAGVVTTVTGVPSGAVAADSLGNVYILSTMAVTRLAADGTVETLWSGATGKGLEGYLAVDNSGDLFFTVTYSHVVRAGVPGSAAAPTISSISTSPAWSGRLAQFTALVGGTPAPVLQWQLSTDTGVSWTNVAESAPYSGTTTAVLTVNPVTPALGNARFRIVATSVLGTAVSSAGTLQVASVVPSPSSLRFVAYSPGPGAGSFQGTGPQDVTVAFSSLTSAWTAASDQPWLQITNGTGTGFGRFTATVDGSSGSLPASGSLAATITLTPTVAPEAAVSIPVTLTVTESTSPPFGMVETPTQNATGVVGSIGVTGWALDDVGISSVKLYRICLSFEPAANCQVIGGLQVVYMGDADIVPGARPDVEGAYPSVPQASRAGWGFLLLTNMLPHVPNQLMYGGQGNLQIYVLATDVEGHQQWLGRSTGDQIPTVITMANDTATRPFGAIDTPGQGQTLSGAVWNFGWALTPDADTTAGAGDIVVPTNGSTMWVWIDGAPVSTVTYNLCRGDVGSPVPAGVFCNDDVANIFGNPTPQPTFTTRTANATKYRNLDGGRGAIGAYYLDTTLLANGRHSIVWSVTDSAGRVDGIGSRDFIVLNAGAGAVASDAVAQIVGDAAAVTERPARTGDVWGRAGFDPRAPWEIVEPDGSGTRQVRIPQLGRLELWLGADVTTGYVAVNGTLRPLPAGSQLRDGVFTWAPPVAYFGAYDLVFLDGTAQVPVTVTIQGARESRIDGYIDAPTANATVRGAFVVAGWAADPSAWNGSGIGAVHVWAHRRDAFGVMPTFLGAAELGLWRPDVAAQLGARFERVGWSLTSPSLPPGEYDVVAYFWSAKTQRFEAARVVHVTVR